MVRRSTAVAYPPRRCARRALYLTGFRRRDVYGIGLDLAADLTLERMRKRAAAVSEVAGRAVRANIERHGIELVRGHGTPGRRPKRRGEPRATGATRTLRAQRILIATGSRPYRPQGRAVRRPGRPRLRHDPRASTAIPASLVVIGGGPVGCEYASIFTALGVRVTLVDRAERLMPFLDGEASAQLRTCLTDMGMRLLLGSPHAEVGRRRRAPARCRSADGETVETDMVLYAAGRSGNTEELGLEAAGVELDARGRILVDAEYRPPCPASTPPATSSARRPWPPSRPSRAAWRCATPSTSPSRRPSTRCRPSASTPSPRWPWSASPRRPRRPPASSAAAGRFDFAHNPRSLIAGTTYGFIKLVFRRDDRRLLGVHIVGEEAAELIHVGQAVLHAGETIDRFIHTTFNIPTRSEVYKYAAYDGLQQLAGRSVSREARPQPAAAER